MKGKAPESSCVWFRQARFGMFVHYGLYSIPGRGEWVMFRERIPQTEYRKLIQKFRPKEKVVEQWVRLARKSGMKYMVLTARHHDGFCLFGTTTDDNNSVQAVGRDIVGEYVRACHKYGIGIGLYYSVADWNDNRFISGPKQDPVGWRGFVKKVHSQLRELMTRYGEIKYLFYDGCPAPETWRCAEINAAIRKMQKGILISDRCGLNEDVLSREKFTGSDPGKLWETCTTTNGSWGYNKADHQWKTPRYIVTELFSCAHNGGNYLLNIGPQADGTVPVSAVKILRSVGSWMRRNGRAIYGTEPHPFSYHDQHLSTAKGKTVFIGLQEYYGPETVVAGVGNKVRSVSILGTQHSIIFRQEKDRLFLVGLPRREPDPLLTVLQIEVQGTPRGVPNPLRWNW